MSRRSWFITSAFLCGLLLSALCLLALAHPSILAAAPTAVIASQDFNGLSDSGTTTFDSLPSGSQLTNIGANNSGGGGLDFHTYWVDTRSVISGPVTPSADTSDFIGVSSFAGSRAPDVAPDGTAVSSGSEHNFQFNDGDGRLDLVFAGLDLSGYGNRVLTFNYWIAVTGYESDDLLAFTLSDGTNSQTYLNYSEPELENNTSVDDGSANWLTATVDLDNLIDNQGFGTTLTLTISVDNNSGDENIFVDNIAFTGDLTSGPVVSLSKSNTPTSGVQAGDLVTYTLVLQNSGTADDNGVLVTDTLPAAVDFAAWINQPAGSVLLNDQLTWSGPLAAGNAITFSFVVTNSAAIGTVINTAQYSGTVTAAGASSSYFISNDLPIYIIQGDGASTPFAGQIVTTTGIVVADHQAATELDGFFLQDPVGDGDDATSDGIFVFDPGITLNVAVGDIITLTAEADESLGLTVLENINAIAVGSSGNPLPAPAVLALPEISDGALEAYEGMLVQVDGAMTIAQNFFLGRYGQMTLSAGERLFQPTQAYLPTSQERADLAAANARRLLILDDGQDVDTCGDNPNPVPYLGAPPPAVIRAGDTVSNLVGVLDFGQINSGLTGPCYLPSTIFAREFRLHPTQSPVFTTGNPRPATPTSVAGALRVASFNVLNYFNGDGLGGNFPTSRGADTLSEFNRQRTKIITAILTIDADIIGLMELENDYATGSLSAIADLVNGLNASAGPGTYQYVNPGVNIGSDAIVVGIIYKPGSVATVGSHAVLDNSFDIAYNDARNRPALAQTFQENGSGERLTVVVNHLKSKGSSCGSGDDDPLQGNCNGTRTTAANVEVAWLATDPTGSGDPDFLILGDLNAYALEDPMVAFANGGFTDLAVAFLGNAAYSYIFDGHSGTLDYALANATLFGQVRGVTEWHINTDEPAVIDYNQEFNPVGYYAPDVYRASDHDKILVGLDLGGVVTAFNSIQDGNWHDSATWDVPGVPDATSAVTITGGTTVTLFSDAQARNLTIAPGGTLVIPAGVTLTVEAAFSNQGTIRHTRSAVPAGTTTRFGHIRNQSGSVDKYHGVDLTPSSGGMGGTTVAISGFQSGGCSADPTDPLIQRCYEISPTTPQTATIRFWYSEGERNDQDADGMQVWHFTAGAGWDPDPVGGDYAYSEITNNCLSRSGHACWQTAQGIDTYSPFALGDGLPTPAAIALQLSGVVTATNTAVQFTWTPASFSSYQLWRGSAPYGSVSAYQTVPLAAYLEIDGVATPITNYYYEVFADIAGKARGQSNRLGVFTFAITPGTP